MKTRFELAMMKDPKGMIPRGCPDSYGLKDDCKNSYEVEMASENKCIKCWNKQALESEINEVQVQEESKTVPTGSVTEVTEAK